MKILTVVGARPQFVKATLVSEELVHRGHREVLVHSGQHYDYNMSESFFKQLALPRPDHHLNVGSASHATQTAAMLERLEPLVSSEQPDWCLVYGDTNTTLAGALVAAKAAVPLAHVEAGLRSFNRRMPEEINRIVADHLADAHLVPHQLAAGQLAREGIHENVIVTGDLMVDLLKRTVARLPETPHILQGFHLSRRGYAVATVHRPSNTDDVRAFERIVAALRGLGLPVIFPVHPRTRPLVDRLSVGRNGDAIIVCDPLPYEDMIALQRDARVILTDSGGMQKEAYVLRIPCVTLREETEWTETLADGWNVLAGSDPPRIRAAAHRERPSSGDDSIYGDGRAATKVVEALEMLLRASPAAFAQRGLASR